MAVKVRDGDNIGRTIKTVDDLIAYHDGPALVQIIVTMTGSSGGLVAGNNARQIVLVVNAKGNDTAVVGVTGVPAALDEGIPVEGGDMLKVTGAAARSAMTQLGTAGQKLTVYVG